MIDRQALFAQMRRCLFSGHLTQGTVDGTDAILDHWDAFYSRKPIAWLAYALATTYHETDHTMEPIEEVGHGRGRPYGLPDITTHQTYYGRGFVQLTWKANYERQSKKLGVDFVRNPELVMRPKHAAAILLDGMRDGDFTGHCLKQYFNAMTDNPTQARRIVNGVDRCSLIALHHATFLAGLGDTTTVHFEERA
jgi:hypothetical protein